MKSLNPATQQPYKIFWFGDLVTPSGFGRIGNEVCKRLVQRGYSVQGASLSYTGWPYNPAQHPYHVWPLGGRPDMWQMFVGAVNAFQPDLLISCQDFPYHRTIWDACKIDFSKIKWMWITPIDGTPVHPDWLELVDYADGAMVISEFGVEAMRRAGKRAALCHPGVDTAEFYPAEAKEKTELRQKAGYADSDYIIGVVCMNQGRKAISSMLEAFYEFARDKPEARLFLDMDKTSGAGWDIPNLIREILKPGYSKWSSGWSEAEQNRVRFREDLFKGANDKPNEAMLPLRNRYALLDAHMVISHREGFGLPLLESMACRIPSIALDWCSGSEICGDERGILVKRLEYMEHGTWGGARDAFPDMDSLIASLGALYHDRVRAAFIAKTGYDWAVTKTWDATADQVENVLQSALARERKMPPDARTIAADRPTIGLSDVHGPGYDPTAGTIGGDPQPQQSPGAYQVPGQPKADGDGSGESGTTRNFGAG